MANKFDSTNYPTQVPSELQLGDFWAWKREDLVNDYPTSLYSLSYEFHEDSGGGGSHKFTATATETSSAYIVEIASATTANYSAGDYKYYAFITRTSDSERITVDEGLTTVTLNFGTTNADVRTHAKKVLDAIEAVIENRASMDQQSMSIAGRSLSRMSIDDLMTFRDRYKAEYLKEVKIARIKNGLGSGNTIKVAFGQNHDVRPKSYR